MASEKDPARALVVGLSKQLKHVFPPVMGGLLTELASPAPDISRLAELLRLDPVLSAKVLGLVNSPYYAQEGQITDLKRASVVLGTRELLSIALSVTMISGSMDKRGCEELHPHWRLTIWSAVAAELLAEALGHKRKEEAYIAALLKDMATLLMNNVCDEEAESAVDHAALSAELLTLWNIPEVIVEGVKAHHDINKVKILEPLHKAVALATAWAEKIAVPEGDPLDIVRFEIMLSELTGGVNVPEMHEQCLLRFKSMLDILHIGEEAPEKRLYEIPVHAMQLYSIQGMEIPNCTSMNDVAVKVAEQLQWNFDALSFDLILYDAVLGGFERFTASSHQKVHSKNVYNDLDEVSEDRRSSHALVSGEKSWGKLLLPKDTAKGRLGEIALYVRFLASGYEQYCLRRAPAEAKAATLEDLPVGVAKLDAKGGIVQSNRRMEEFLATAAHTDEPSEDQSPSEDSSRVVPVFHYEDLNKEWQGFLDDPERTTLRKVLCILKDGDPADARCIYVSALRRELDDKPEMLLLMEDVSEITELELESLKQKEFLERLLDSMREVVLMVDGKGDILFASSRYAAGLKGRNLFQLTFPVEDETTKWNDGILQKIEHPIETIMFVGGELRPFELVVSPLVVEGGDRRMYLIVGRDLTTIRRLEERIKHQAIYDGLTGLYNHDHFMHLLSREISRAGRLDSRALGVMFMDLDGFKAVNDKHGHQAGDRILKHVGDCLRQNVRMGMDYPCRYGGDEFAVIVTEIKKKDLQLLAERIKNAVRRQSDNIIGVSIGIAMLREEENAGSILRRADQAAYLAKAKGGHTVVFVD